MRGPAIFRSASFRGLEDVDSTRTQRGKLYYSRSGVRKPSPGSQTASPG